MGFIMILMTYLLPNKLIIKSMDNINIYIKDKTENKFINNIIVSFFGLCIMASIIFSEFLLLKFLKKYLIHFGSFITNIWT